MNCRANILTTILVLVGVFLVNWPSNASSDAAVKWDQFQKAMTIVQSASSAQGDVYSTYPLWLQGIYTYFLNWEPRVIGDISKISQCRLSFSSQTLSARVSEASQFLKNNPDCAYLPEAADMGDLRKVVRALSVEFDISDPEHFRKAIFKIPSSQPGKNVHVRGLFGVHDSQKPRPLVILRMGVHGNVDEFLAERFLAKIIYEDFGFNFLALENLTSHGYLALDNPITFGGVDEGLQTYFILQNLKQSGIKNLITDIHLLGISLGANGIFLTQTLDEENQRQLKSVMALCPVINLVKTLTQNQDSQLAAGIIDLWNYRRLQAVRERMTELDPVDWWQTILDFKPRYVPGIMRYLEKNQLRPSVEMPINIQWPKGLRDHFQSAKSFSDLNNFWPYYKNKKTPILIMTTPNDPLVPTAINTSLIGQRRQPGVFEKTEILELDRGIHCGFVTDYRWEFIIDLFKIQWGETLP